MTAVALLGDINIDLVLNIPVFPPEGGEAIATRQGSGLGGSSTNTAVSLARMGYEARLIGRVGDDAWGRQALSDLASVGVKTNWISRDPVEPTQLNVVTVSNGGERTMFAYRGANALLGPSEVTADIFAGVSLLHLSGYALLQSPQADAALRALELANSLQIPVTLDIPAGVAEQIAGRVNDLLSRIDTIMLGEADLVPLGATTPEMLIERGVKRVALKRGASGSALYRADSVAHANGLDVSVVDTTGAGDAFAAGQIVGRLADLPGETCCLLANALGAAAVRHSGAGLAMPGSAEVRDLLGIDRQMQSGTGLSLIAAALRD